MSDALTICCIDCYVIGSLTYSLNTGKQDNILQRNLFVMLTSDEMVAQSRLLGIIHLSCMLPLRWLAGNTHKLKDYNWGVRSMSKALNVFYEKLQLIQANPRLVLSEIFMTSLFGVIMDELPPFQEYWTYLYKKKTMNVVSRKSGARLMGLAKAREELFNPTIETNKLCQARVIQLAQVFADVVLVEFRDKKKATWRNLDDQIRISATRIARIILTKCCWRIRRSMMIPRGHWE